ncbi:DUF4118 domain-containing protein [Undibacterium cyanobacteriorum]|uniref:histidine kinase n=1 Tax=Undibacterium cyanobacteriorum TaxID=3073561 RepID=A0ABY9RKY1_9BURK|nr:ATP-binding protein [Undibacterium sp. 20NA77.5]WMW81863.1 DUF4118 domain-containing protein [Undibacterium sp. 20NA77.5]
MNNLLLFASRGRHSFQQAMLLSLLMVVSCGLSMLLEDYVSFTGLAMIYILAIVLAAYFLDRYIAILAAFIAVLSLNYFFIEPRYSFHIDRSENALALLTMLVVALVINRLTTALKLETESAHLNETRAKQLQELAITLANCQDLQRATAVCKNAFRVAFHGTSYLALINHQGELDCQSIPLENANGLRACIQEKSILGTGTLRWPDLNAWYIPLGDSHFNHNSNRDRENERDNFWGAVCVTQVAHLDTAAQDHARALCSLFTQVLTRLDTAEAAARAHNEAEKQQLQSTFLSAISHDLRTPLAVVVGAASSLQSQRDKLSANEQDKLLHHIIDEANYLTSVTENTLQFVRLSSSTPNLRQSWEAMEEIIGAIVTRLRRRQDGHRIAARVEENLALLRVDPVLISQLISNLIDNALKYSEGTVEIVVKQMQHGANQVIEVAVKDRGPGIPLQEHQTIFEAYSRLATHDQSSQRSAGLGLAVCMAIARAHHGQLSVRNRRQGGCNFLLHLPVEQEQPLPL